MGLSLLNFTEVRPLTRSQTEPDISSITYTLKFEGTLPGTTSRFGIHTAGSQADSWLLADPKANFCEDGVEIGDIVIIEQFRLRPAGSLTACSQWITPDTTGHPQQRLEPLRYRVKNVGIRTLVLEQDQRETYGQVARSATQPRPQPAPALPPPPQECVEDGFTYRVRTADNEWLLETDSGGYRHPWVDDGDQCHADQRNPFRGRFIFGDTVNDGIVEFRLQSPDLEAQCDDSSCKPYLIDSSFSFTVSKGNAEKGGGGDTWRRLCDDLVCL